MNTQISSSKRFQLNKTDLWKIGRGFLIVMAGTALTYFSAIVLKINWVIPVGNEQFLNLTPLAIPLFSLVIDTVRKFLNNYQTELVALDIENEIG